MRKKRQWDDIVGTLETAMNIAKRHEKRYKYEPFNTICDYLPYWMHEDEELMEKLEEIFTDWLQNGGHGKYEFPSAYIVRELTHVLKDDE